MVTEESKRCEFEKLESDTIEAKRKSDDKPILTQRTLRFKVTGLFNLGSSPRIYIGPFHEPFVNWTSK